MHRAVLDTNVIVSGIILTTGAPAEILTAWRERRFDLIIGPAILSELDRVLRLSKIARKYAIDLQTARAVVELLVSRAIIVTGSRAVSSTLRDPRDHHVLACATEGHADYVVTGDRDLLVLARHREIPIISPAAFAALLKASKEPCS